jgi:serine/threonine-protein kinase
VIGQKINNYEIKSRLGEGGMGAVYLAEHPYIRRKAAVKVLRRSLAEDATLVERFMNEARAANAVNHPNIIDIMDVGTLPDGVPYLLMEYLDGETLAARLERTGRLALGEAIAIVRQTASALAAAHAVNVVHRDLKPDNLYLVRSGTIPGEVRVKVLDFGIAKLRGDLAGASQTSSGVLMGTPLYMSPEQCRGVASQIDRRTDIYALGVILYEMLCGRPPFQSEGTGEVLVMHIAAVPVPPRQHAPEIPAHVEAVILRALAKSPGDRFTSMDDFMAALDAGPLPVATRPPSLVAPPERPREVELGHASTTLRSLTGEVTPVATVTQTRRRSRALLIGGGAAAAVIAGFLLLGRGHQPVQPLPATALPAATPAPAIVPPPAIPAPIPPPPPIAAPPVVEAPAPVTPPMTKRHKSGTHRTTAQTNDERVPPTPTSTPATAPPPRASEPAAAAPPNVPPSKRKTKRW